MKIPGIPEDATIEDWNDLDGRLQEDANNDLNDSEMNSGAHLDSIDPNE